MYVSIFAARLSRRSRAAGRAACRVACKRSFKSVVSHLKLSVNMVTATSDQQRGARVKQARVTPLRHFLCFWYYYFFPIPHWIFCCDFFKVSTICEEYKKYWNNGICLSNKVTNKMEIRTSEPKRPQVPGLWLTHLPLVPHIYASVNWVSIVSGNGLSPVRCEAITWNNAALLSIGPLGKKLQWDFNRNSNIFIQEHVFESVVCEMVPFCPGEMS